MEGCINYDVYEKDEELEELKNYVKELLETSRTNLRAKEKEYERVVQQPEALLISRSISHWQGRIYALNLVLAKLLKQ